MKAIGMRIIGVVAFLLVMASVANAWQVKLAWDASSSDPSIIGGYYLYYRRPLLGETTYVNRTDVGNVLIFQVINLDPGTEYCFVASTYGTGIAAGQESGFSNEVCTTQPVTLFVQPLNGDTVAGTKLVSIGVTDTVFPNGTNSVTLDIHNTGIWTPIAYNPATGLYEINWNTTSYGTTAPEAVELSTVAINPDQIASDPDIITVTVDNRPHLHIGDLANTSFNAGSTWTSRVQVTVHNAAHSLVAGATVSGTWQNITGNTSCTTSAAGTCSVSVMLHQNVKSILFSVTSITQSGAVYQPSANHDPDGDSNGTTILVTHP